MVATTSVLPGLWRAAAQQGQLSACVPHTLWRCRAGQPAAAPLPVSACERAGHRVAAAGSHLGPCRARAALPGSALVLARALRRSRRTAGRRAADRVRREPDHRAGTRSARGGTGGGRAWGRAALLHRWLPSRVAGVAHSGRPHRGGSRRRLRSQLGRPDQQLRADRRPLGAGGPHVALSRLGARL